MNGDFLLKGCFSVLGLYAGTTLSQFKFTYTANLYIKTIYFSNEF